MAHRYYHLHPRQIANECALVRTATAAEAAEAEALGYERITRADAARHIRWINAENDTWGSGRASGAMRLEDASTAGEAFAAARNRAREAALYATRDSGEEN